MTVITVIISIHRGLDTYAINRTECSSQVLLHPLLQMCKLRFGELTKLPKATTASKWHSLFSNVSSPSCRACAFNPSGNCHTPVRPPGPLGEERRLKPDPGNWGLRMRRGREACGRPWEKPPEGWESQHRLNQEKPHVWARCWLAICLTNHCPE